MNVRMMTKTSRPRPPLSYRDSVIRRPGSEDSPKARMFDRRVFLTTSAFGAAGVLASGQPLFAQGLRLAQAPAAPAPALAPAPAPAPPAFGFETVSQMARELARKPYAAPSLDLPAPFASLTYEQYVGIRNKPGAALWSDAGLPFVIEPLHRGGGGPFAAPILLSIVEDGAVKPLSYDPAAFDFGKLSVPAKLPDLGFSGFRVLRARPDAPSVEIAAFQGQASYRAIARGQSSGAVARALAIRTADPKGEEFPLFRAMWIERPAPSSDRLVIHALLDSESVAGAYRFVLRYGDVTVVDVEATLFPRVAVAHVGYGQMQATSLFAPLERRRGADDLRAAVYEVSGLQMHTGGGEWLWRPVTNRDSIQVSAFVDQNPKLFGLVQRERDFARFYDDDQHWEMRPSLYVEPMGDWGPGAVQLAEIPAESESNDNIIAYWRPRDGLAQGVQTTLAYRQIWCWDLPDPPPLAMVTQSRSGKAGSARRRRFVVEFSGGQIGDPGVDIRADLTAQPGAITGLRTFIARDRKTMRVVFDVEPAGEACELRLVLTAAGKPVSETWLYRWTP